jgi:hypothetical protein
VSRISVRLSHFAFCQSSGVKTLRLLTVSMNPVAFGYSSVVSLK